jgi:hypothetical protein
MATKAQIEANIDAKLASAKAGGITAAQHRAAIKDDAVSLLNEMYNTSTVTDTQASTNILTKNPEPSYSDLQYSLDFKKQGGVVYINGTITNTGGNTYSSITLATVTDSEYQSPITMKIPSFTENTASGGLSSNSEIISLSIDTSDNFRIVDTLPANGTLYINTFYFVGA